MNNCMYTYKHTYRHTHTHTHALTHTLTSSGGSVRAPGAAAFLLACRRCGLTPAHAQLGVADLVQAHVPQSTRRVPLEYT